MHKMPKIYLDYAASTPVDPAVFRAMKPYFMERFGNPGSLHSFGQEGIAAIDVSRESIAKAIGAEFREIIFTAGATEANNMVLRGVVKAAQGSGFETKIPRIIVSAIEHESILETARELECDGVEVVFLPVDHRGVVDLKKMKESLTENTVLVSVMYANNEIGSIQPISEIGAMIRDFREEHGRSKIENPKSTISGMRSRLSASNFPLFHTDAAQAFQFLDCDVRRSGVDFMTLSAHKIYGPKGVGALYMRQAASGKRQASANRSVSRASCCLLPLLSGGGQEFGFRSGTENVSAIAGFAAATELRDHLLIQTNEQMRNLKNQLWEGIKRIYPKANVNGVAGAANKKRGASLAADYSPNILNVYFPYHDAQDLVTRFDLAGLAVSSGSACRSRAMESSYVIQALGHSKERAKSSVRFSFGRPTTKRDIDETLKIIKKVLTR